MAPTLPPNVPLDPLPALPPNVPLDPLLQDLGTQQTKSQPSQTTEIRASQTKADKVGTKMLARYSENEDDEEDKCDFDKDYDETLKAEILALHGPVTLPGLMKKFQQVLYNTHVVPIAPVIEPIHKSSRKGSKKRKKLGQGQVAKHDPIYAEVVDKEIDKAQKTKKQVTRKIAHTKLKRARAIQKGLESIAKGKDGTDARPPANVLGKRKQPVRSSRLGNLGGKRPRDAADSSDGDNTSLESSGVSDEESDQEGVASEAYEESTNAEGQGNVNMIPSESGVLDYPLVPKTSDPQGNIGPIPTVPGVLDNPHTAPQAELPQGHVGMTPMVPAGPQKPTIPLLPLWISKYVQLTYDPPGDGNCGYRCVAHHLAVVHLGGPYGKPDGWHQVRTKLLDELNSNKVKQVAQSLMVDWEAGYVPMDKWMSDVDIGPISPWTLYPPQAQ
ncbi:hypothetical protein PGT21_002351 [Puccinia graminis f. sp. tritici]|uniref:OTU domain-containing protein n=1 Tax=Puccinia graminis f. sp. tritici TaxID=56615 RepID=A0A5B0MU58_PUCGR|nr:hypothetical protein PGT21_002351 [Puccinia graminis f. sp. tritici]KAA1079953.1 hypothetical protein PGTUg99_012774 [Puccinia graminis f. sp. tritici]